MMATSIVGTLPPLSINSTWRTPNFLSSGPRHRILDSYYGNYDLDCFSRIPETQEGKMASQWTNIKPANLDGEPTFEEAEVEQGKVTTTIRFLEFKFEVPLDHSDTSADTRTLFLHAKLVYDYFDEDKPKRPETVTRSTWKEIVQDRKNNLLLYLPGGPGDGNDLKNPALKKAALQSGYHVLFVDYRGTGQSSAITTAPEEGAEYLAMFRQDNIVRDLEAIRLYFAKELLPGPKPELEELKFSLLGQSYGGWIILTYLSFLPDSLKRVGIHAGLPPLGDTVEDLYRETFKQVIKQNVGYYNTYKDDAALVREIVVKLEENPRKFTSDGTEHTVTGRTFLTIGRNLGADDGPGQIHDLVEHMHADLEKPGDKLRDKTREKYLKCLSFKLHERPLYGVMHESIYCSGPGVQSRWAAERVAKEQGDEFSWVNDGEPEKLAAHTGEFYFSGEMIYPFMLENSGSTLFAFKQVAEDLACKDDWPKLYDQDQLANNKVEARAMVYTDDMYVAWKLADETAKLVGKESGKKMETVNTSVKFKGYSHKSIKEASKAPKVFNALFPEPGATD